MNDATEKRSRKPATNHDIDGLTDLGNDKWRFRVWGPGPDGTRRQWSYTFIEKRIRERNKIIAAFRSDATSGKLAARERAKHDDAIAPSRTTTLAAYAQRWLANRRASRRVGEKTLLRYARIIRDQIGPALGSKTLGAITPADVNNAIAMWHTIDRKDRKAGKLSARTIHHAYATLRAILASAVDEEILGRNPIAKDTRVSKSDAKEVAALTFSQVAQLLEGLRGTILAMPTMLLIWTGLRRGKLLGLRWTDVDLEAGTLRVEQSLERLADGTLRFKEPKTKFSRRTVPLGAHVVAALKQHRFDQADRVRDFGPTFNPDRLVFPWVDGSRWNPDDFSMRFYRTVRAKKLPITSVHGLRHTHASLGLRAGMPMKIVSESLGHSDIRITANRYTHMLPTHHIEAMALVDAALVAAIDAHKPDVMGEADEATLHDA